MSNHKGPGGNGRSCVVTGSTGFVGLNLVDELLGEGWNVFALHRPLSRRAEMLQDLPNAKFRRPGSLNSLKGDISKDELAELIAEQCGKTSIDTIFHLVNLNEKDTGLVEFKAERPAMHTTSAGWTPEGGPEHIRVNLDAMHNVIRGARACDARRIVYCSSWSAYGMQPAGTVVSESTPSLAEREFPLWGSVPYFVQKFRCENALKEAARRKEIEAVIIQPASVFGRFGEEGWCQLVSLERSESKPQ